MEELDAMRISDVLDADSRPTFVLDLDPDDASLVDPRTLQPVFCNAALRSHERLLEAVTHPGSPTADPGSPDNAATFGEFRAWAAGATPHDDSKDVFPLSHVYADLLWTGSTVRRRWRLISGIRTWRHTPPLADLSSGALLELATGGVEAEQPKPSRRDETTQKSQPTPALPAPRSSGAPSAPSASATLVSSSKAPPPLKSFFPSSQKLAGSSSSNSGGSGLSSSITLSLPEKAVADWTAANPKGVLSDHLKLARSVDWANTPLGAMKDWSPEFRQTANLCMNNPHPAALFWGSELTMLYNEAYAREVAGTKSPALLGSGFSGPFSELWDYAGPVFAECARTGISVRKENDYLPIDRHGLLEETYFAWSFTPLYGGTDRILGFYNAPFETTQQVLNQRRTMTINKVGEHAANAKTVKQFWRFVLDGLEDNHFDVPMALLYSVGDTEDADYSSMSSGSTLSLKSCHLEGGIGVPEGHVAAPQQLDLKRSREGFVPSFREAMRIREPTLLHTRDGTLPEVLLDGIEWRGFEEACREVIIFPVRPTNGDSVMAFLVLGVNPRRLYDDEYKAFTAMLNRQLATSLASVILFEDEVRRSRDAAETAALEKEQLTQQLNLQANRLRRMTEFSPLGMFLISPEGVLREANDRFFEMTSNTRDSQYELSWMDFVAENSAGDMEEGWRRLVKDHVPWSGELQLKKRPAGHPAEFHGEPMEYWVMFNAHSEFSTDGSGTLRSIMGSITDISHLKWAQGMQIRKLQEADETRRRQNEFIDITSHEMRNPLSAILQCADDIKSTLGEYVATKTCPTQPILESCVESTNTIALCVQHQKSIVDDILTISKLDSNLLVITPTTAQPESILERVVKMFDPELQAKDIMVAVDRKAAYKELAVDWVTLDPSRVLQVLINLMTNAIKFTAPSDKRVITVALDASLTPPDPSRVVAGFQYVPPQAGHPNLTASEEWDTGEVVYVSFMVQDTGCGLTPEEKQILFQRFKQASPRTHAQYGGSGLGLFISKRLAELHGGQIGVASGAGEGSTFGFFVKTRRTPPPREAGAAAEVLTGIERELGGDKALSHHVTPQRQDLASSGPAASLVATKARPRVDPKELDILVVEDNLINQRVLVNQLKKVGCTVGAANDGLEALAFLEETHFRRPEGGGRGLSVVLMDLEMPNMDGLTCVRAIRQMEADGAILQHVPVIAVTANVRDEHVAAAKRSGMDDVVSKPFRIPELLEKVAALLKDK